MSKAVTSSWLKGYNPLILKQDLLAGLIVAVMLVPQAMAYAMLAGLPPVIGLYAATFPLLAYAILGTSRQLAVGPVAIVSLLTADACSRIAGASAGPAELLGLAALLALMVGLIQVVLGLLRAGFLINFVSHGVISGFTSAGAILIGLSQLPQLLGVKTASQHTAIGMLKEVAGVLSDVHWLTLGIGLVATAILLVARQKRWRFPVTLPVIAGATLLAYFFNLEAHGLSCVGKVPGGLPSFRLPALECKTILSLLPPALVIVFISYMESIAVAQWIALKEKYRVSPNREFLGLGLANVVAGLFSGYPVTGGFSRTAVNYQAGSRTPMASVVTAGLVLLVLLALTPLFTYLPKVILAAVIMVAVIGLIDLREIRHLFGIKPADGWVSLVTFLVTLGVGMDAGLLSGIALSLALFIYRTARPRIAVLGRIGDGSEFRDIKVYPEARTDADIIMLRVDASLYFANAGFVEDRIREQLLLQPEAHLVLLDMSAVNDIDAVAISTLENLIQECNAAQIQFGFSGMKAQVRKVIERAGWYEKFPAECFSPGLTQALKCQQLKINQNTRKTNA